MGSCTGPLRHTVGSAAGVNVDKPGPTEWLTAAECASRSLCAAYSYAGQMGVQLDSARTACRRQKLPASTETAPLSTKATPFVPHRVMFTGYAFVPSIPKSVTDVIANESES